MDMIRRLLTAISGAIFISLFASVLFAVPAGAVTLHEALTSGYNHDEDLKIIRQEFLNEVEEFPRALSEFMPRIGAKLENSRSNIARRSGEALLGGDNITRKSERLGKSVTLEQNLFNGGASVAKLKGAQSAFRASRANYYAKEQEIIVNEINAYLTTVEAMKKYDISKTSVKSNRTQLEAMKEKFKLGESTETDVANAEAGLSSSEANQAVAYSNFEAAKANFRRTFGIEPVGISMPQIPETLPKSLEELTERALKVNPAIQSARNSTEASKSNELAAKGALLPSVNFSIQNGRDYFNPQNNQTSDINRRSLTSTLSVNVPILQRGGAEYSDIRRAKYQTRKSAVQLDAQVKRVHANAKASWENFEAAKQRIAAASKGVKAAEIAYDGIVQEEMLGSKTIVDVLTTETRLNEARQSKVEADKELVIAAYNIKSLIGEVTAKSMKLPVEYFEPESEFKSVKRKIVGF